MNKYIIANCVEENIAVLKSMIQKYDQEAEILISNTGAGVYSLLDAQTPKILFINLKLTDQNGADLCKSLKTDPSTKNIHIVLTGTTSELKEAFTEILNSEAEGILSIPLDELSFAIQLRAALKLISSDNSSERIVEFNIDNTDRKQAEKALHESEQVYRNLVERLPDGVYKSTHAGNFIEVNQAMVKMLGYDSKEELLTIDIKSALYFEVADRESLVLQEKLEEMGIFRLKKKDGTGIWVEDHGWYTLDDNGGILYHEGIMRDITERRRTDEALKQTEQKIIQLSKGIEQSPASIIITDINGNIEYVNLKFTEVTGYTFEEIKGRNPKILQSGYTLKEEYTKLWNIINSGNEYHGEIQNRKRNGDLYWESVLISPIRDDEGKIVNFMAIKEDITNRKKSDLELLKLSVAIDQNPASVIITNTSGVIEYVNKKFITVSGYTSNELIGKVVRILKPGHTSEEVYIEIWNKLYAGDEWRGEHLNRTKNREKYWESILISPIKNHEGKINNYIILSEDISDRKKMEKDLIAAKEKAEESDRLKSAFLANMSHEIRTPLNSILGFSELLTQHDLDDDSRTEFAALINSSGNNLLSIINDVLDISKIEAGQVTLSENEFSAQQLVVKIQKEYSLKASSKGIELRLASHPDGYRDDENFIILSDEARIKQVLINFIGNALKFTDSGYIEIGVKMINSSIQFHVKDTGIGIDKVFHDKIFDRFRQVEAAQTRKYGGNGLGLAITKNLAELLGGKIELESEPDKGSTFFFTLPESRLVK